jgi:hypothetical protein
MNPSGTATISWGRWLNDANPRQIIAAGSQTIRITNGVVNVSLFATQAAFPPGSCYRISYTLSQGSSTINSTRYWSIPISSGTVSLNQIEGSIPCNTTSGPLVAPAQITPGPAGSTTVLTSSSAGYVSWLPGGGGGGGNPPFSQITTGVNNSGQTMTVGSTSALTFSGTGIVNANQLLGTTLTALYGASGKLTQGTGTFTSGHLGSFDGSANIADSGLVAANVIVNTGSYADPAWITSLASTKLAGLLPCAALPVLTGDASNTNCAISVTKTGGVAFALSATTDTTNATNITSGALAAGRLPAINLAASGAGGVTGNLGVANLNSGTGANSTTFWRGDATWGSISNGGTVTNTFGALVQNRLVIGNGGVDVTVLASLGTASTVLHGAAGPPTFGPVALATDVSGTLGSVNGGTASQFFSVTGPTALRSFAFPDANASVVTTVASLDLTTLSGNQGFNGFYLVPTTGFYRVTAVEALTRPATTSATTPVVIVSSVNPDSGSNPQINAQIINSSNTNTIFNIQEGEVVFYAASGSTISLQAQSGYASSGPTSMQFSLRIRVMSLGQ